ncbi:hypothetical protein FJK98_14460 [Micromonospora sp. HM134]|uniref:hypothetical protein n=1 Tax=Micromonospora sp. HM134 TaxID=2583243 RepID=UPI00119863E9|nr:hypothetical protein [Micromonospora sp. HM134]QDY08210.1 hypothetical protein FJK98_14460 [Micromonospora sp. HM134]
MRALPRAILTAAAITVSIGVGSTPAHAGTGRGPAGQTLTAIPTSGVARTGATVTVTGSGYDVTKGIYVAFCVDNGVGVAPSPCGGGVDTTGSTGASHWISSDPPSYGEGLAVPYGPGGSFRVTLTVNPRIGTVDCTVRRCVVTSRADHTRTADRSQDVRVPVTFAAAATPAPTRTPAAAPATAGAGGAARTTPPAAAPTGAAGTPAGGAPASAATAVAPAGTGGPAAPADAGDQAQVTRVSAASDTGRWWLVALVVPLLGMALLAGLRRRRRRRAAS